ncbi:MAG: hypothetical protein JXR46_06785 [Calditrichaceae bacterium]|nr:hypothetical protein [Calditrichaceae bacterium]MBN2708735.1 hypothetical protein [Calditrichaceae bacterium]RQV97102.1 MAG: hypothetical protein EH224_02350 [Calditrichota bacterium]
MPGIHGFILKQKEIFEIHKKQLSEAITWNKTDQSVHIEDIEHSVFLTANRGSGSPICQVKISPNTEALMYGELYPVCGADQSALLKDLVIKYLSSDESVFSRTDGAFLIVILEQKPFKIHIINDIFGAFPLNYFHNDNSIVFSSQIYPIVKTIKNLKISEIGLTEYLTLGFPLNGRTVIDGIKRLWPGSILVISENTIRETQYFEPHFHAKKWKTRQLRKEIVDRFENAFSIRYKNDENLITALSGGFDTRVLWAYLLNKQIKCAAYSHGSDESTDLNIARSISANYDIPIIDFTLEKDIFKQFNTHLYTLINMGDGYIQPENFFMLPAYKILADKNPVMMDGVGGQLYRRQLKRRYSNLFHGKKSLTHFLYHQSLHLGFAQKFLNASFLERYLSNVYQDIEDYLHKYRSIGANEDLLDTFHMHQSAGLKFSTDLLVQSYYVNVRQPFYDRSLFELNRLVPPALRKRHIFHRTLVDHYFSQLKKFPLETKGLSIPYHGFRLLRTIPIITEALIKRAGANTIAFKKNPIYNINALCTESLNASLHHEISDYDYRDNSFWNQRIFEDLRMQNIKVACTDKLQLLNTILMLKKLNTVDSDFFR